MKLISLATKNFKKLGDSSFQFTEGLNIIVGDNAKGKSTLLQAIEAALYGVTVIPGKKENVPTWGQTKFSLELKFEVGGDTLFLARTQSTAKLVKIASDADDDELLANGNTPVTAYIEQLLGLTAKDYNLFVQSKQGETAGILTFGGAALSRKVEEFAGIDTIDKVQTLANGRARDAGSQAAALASAAEAFADSEVGLSNAQDIAVDAYLDLTAAKKELAALPALALTWPTPSSEELSRQRRDFDKAQSRLVVAQAELKSCEERLQELESEKWEEPAEADAVSARMESVKAERLILARKVDSVTQALRERQRTDERMLDIEAQASEIVIPEFHISELEAAQTAAEEALTAVNRTAQLREQRQGLRDDATCPTCGTQLSDHDPVKLQEEVNQLTTALAKALQTSNECKAEVTRLTAVEKDHNAQTQRFQAFDTEYVALELVAKETPTADVLAEELAAVTKDHADKANETADCVTEMSLLNSAAAAYQQHKSKLVTARTKVASAKAAVAELPEVGQAVSDEEIDAASSAETTNRNAEREHAQQQRTLEQAVNAAESAAQAAQATVDALSADVAALTLTRAKQTKANAQADVAKRLSRFLGERRATYLQQVWDSVLAAASRQVQLSSDGLINGVGYRDSEFFFTEDGIDAPISAASGAQKAHIGVAVRLGLARALYGSDSLLILDEPTESMSERHASNLAGSLAGTAKQLMLITHREQDQALAANLVSL